MTKTAFVTGASSGIGEATVRQLIADGFQVFAAARRTDRMAPLAEQGAILVPLDVTNDTSMVAAIEDVRRKAGRLDLLVNNAGYGSYGALEDVAMDEARRQVEVNLMGLARMCQLALPLMRAQGSGRIINITSVGGKFHEPFGAWYHATKFAVEGLSDCLRVEVKPFGIDVVVIEPGAILTEWNKIARDGLVAASGSSDYAPYARRHAAMLAGADESKMTSLPDVVARTIGRAATARRPHTRYATGGGARIVLFLRSILSDRMFDRLVWAISQSPKPV